MSDILSNPVEYERDGVKEIPSFDNAELEAFLETLKGSDALKNYLRKINDRLKVLWTQAEELRMQQEWKPLTQGNVWGMSIVSIPSSPEITKHNEEIGNILQMLRDFNKDRTNFYQAFIQKYVSQKVVRIEPAVWTRGPARPAWDDMFSQGIRDNLGARSVPRGNNASRQDETNAVAWMVASALGLKRPQKPPEGWNVLDENGNLTGWSLSAAETAFNHAWREEYDKRKKK
jgi:hypothetical protein